MIKKTILIALSCSTMTTNASNFYIKGGAGLSHIATTKFSNTEFQGKNKLAGNFPLVEAGIGYRLTDTIRADLLIDYYFLFRSNETSTSRNNDLYKVESKTKADTLMLNVYKDICIYGRLTPFVGGGIGVAKLKESASGYVVSQEDSLHYTLDAKSKKSIKHFAYKLTAGTDIKISDAVIGEISYNYFNLGNNKTKTIGGLRKLGNRSYAIHNITLGMRISI
jgi:opacity protein-like surface antigen